MFTEAVHTKGAERKLRRAGGLSEEGAQSQQRWDI